MYFDALCVQDSNVFDLLYYKKLIKNLSFFEISQKGKRVDAIDVLETHINKTFAQILSYSTFYYQKIRRYKHKGVKPLHV